MTGSFSIQTIMSKSLSKQLFSYHRPSARPLGFCLLLIGDTAWWSYRSLVTAWKPYKKVIVLSETL